MTLQASGAINNSWDCEHI